MSVIKKVQAMPDCGPNMQESNSMKTVGSHPETGPFTTCHKVDFNPV